MIPSATAATTARPNERADDPLTCRRQPPPGGFFVYPIDPAADPTRTGSAHLFPGRFAQPSQFREKSTWVRLAPSPLRGGVD